MDESEELVRQMRNVVVTGAAGQLGQVFTKYLASQEALKVFALDLAFDGVPEIAGVEYKTVDITDENAVVAFFEALESVDVVINNAGIGVFTPFEQRTVDEFMSVVDVNLKGTFLMCREAIKRMKVQQSGKIINIGSVYGVVSSDPRIYGDSGRNNSEVYSMTKAGVIMLSKYLCAHYASDNIQVNSLSPGGVKRAQTQDFVDNYTNKTAASRMAAPEDFLPALDYLLDVKNTYLSGQNIVIDGGFTAW